MRRKNLQINEIGQQTIASKSLENKNSSQHIAIIAQGYGDEEDSENDDGDCASSKEDLKNADNAYTNKLENQCDNRPSTSDQKQKDTRNSR